MVRAPLRTRGFLSITARAEVMRDHAKTAQIWTTIDNMSWSGPDDPNACLLRVVPLTAELWDGPAKQAGSGISIGQIAADRRKT
jgi:general stress protein 26